MPAAAKPCRDKVSGVMSRVLFLLLAIVLAALAEDWPEWRGKGRLGVWNETGVLQKFPDTGLKSNGGFESTAVSADRQ